MIASPSSPPPVATDAEPRAAASLRRRLREETPWREETVLVYGKRYLQPRLTAWFGEAGTWDRPIRMRPAAPKS